MPSYLFLHCHECCVYVFQVLILQVYHPLSDSFPCIVWIWMNQMTPLSAISVDIYIIYISPHWPFPLHCVSLALCFPCTVFPLHALIVWILWVSQETQEERDRLARKREAEKQKKEKDAAAKERERLRAEIARDKELRKANKGVLPRYPPWSYW